MTLPGGRWVDGERRRDAALRPLTGADEAFLLDEANGLPPAQWATALLARCVERLGPSSAVDADAVRALTAGDREALLLHVRRLAFGDRLECVLPCPACGEALDVALDVGDLLLPPYADSPPEREAELDGVLVRFRLPTGADQEAAALAAGAGAEAAAALVLGRCVTEPAPLPGELAEALGTLMGELDPQADIVLELGCPACGESVSTPFDAADFLAREIGRDRDALLSEIHLLALHYHWPESELAGMTPQRRRRYVTYLAEALGR